jgi:DNA-binding winged helix-turn-helix (wHTH) protein/Tol biopolymer transport system component
MNDRDQNLGLLRFGPFELERASGELRKGGALIKLQSQPFQLLALLAGRTGQVVSREEIRQTLWDNETFVDFDRSINFCVNKVREALGDDPQSPRYVETLPRMGYRFIAPITECDGDISSADAAPAVERTAVYKPFTPFHGTLTHTALPNAKGFQPLPWAAAVFGIVGMTAFALLLWHSTRQQQNPLIRLSVDLGPDALPGLDTTVSISPDGRRIVFPVRGPQGKQALATRVLDQPKATLLPGTDNASDAFFSPDGQWIGFFADSQLKKVSVFGGTPVSLCPAANASGGSWSEDGTIVASLSTTSGLSRVPSSGGHPQFLTKLEGGDGTHRWPQVLPGGQSVLYTASVATVGLDDARIDVVQLKTGAKKTLLRGGYFGRYVRSGHLVYVHQGVLFAVAFDVAHLTVLGTPSPVLDDVAASPARGGGQFDLSRTGTFIYVAGKTTKPGWPVVWLDSSGKIQPLLTKFGVYSNPRFSPDGRQLAITDGGDIWIFDLRQNTMRRLTFSGQTTVPVWAPDGKHIAFRSISSESSSISWVRADGSGEVQQLLTRRNNITPYSFSSDSRQLAYYEIAPETRVDLWTLQLDVSDPDRPKPAKPVPFLRTPYTEALPVFSPDGHWIAYRSDESGTSEIYVRPFPGTGGQWQVSTAGGLYAAWSTKTQELFYETIDNRIMVVSYKVNGESFVPSAPHLWSDTQIFSLGVVNLALAPDGKRFAVFPIPEPIAEQKVATRVTFLLNFFDELRIRFPPVK